MLQHVQANLKLTGGRKAEEVQAQAEAQPVPAQGGAEEAVLQDVAEP